MIIYQTIFTVSNLSANELTDFMVNCNDDLYRKWWAGTHIAFHTTKRFPNNVGNCVVFDEYVGTYRLRFKAVLDIYEPGKAMVWHMKKIIPLPARLSLLLNKLPSGVQITHTLSIGYNRTGSVLDGLIRAFLPKELERDLADHAQYEFRNLRDSMKTQRN